MYNYCEEMQKDIQEVLPDYLPYYDKDYIVNEDGEVDREELLEKLNDDLWLDDAVTGNASGSYFCNSKKAQDAIGDNLDLLCEALREFDCGWDFIAQGWEACDVTIRCYMLNHCIYKVIDSMTDKEIIDIMNT